MAGGAEDEVNHDLTPDAFFSTDRGALRTLARMVSCPSRLQAS